MGQRRWFWLAIASAFLACGDNIHPEPDPDSIVTIELETHAPAQVAAGDTITVSCTILENDIVSMVTAEVKVVDEAKVMRMGETIVARTVGTVDVACALPGRGLVDVTPAQVEIVHGAAANVVTTITPDPVVAGNSITATCEVYDAYGNPITTEMPTLQLSPDDSANTITDLNALMIRAGHYTGRCHLPGTTSNNAGFDVIPNLPATLAISKVPDLPVYAINAIVDVTHLVTDRYGNEIYNASVTKTSAAITGVGPTITTGPGQYRYGGEGLYRVTASVDPPTDMNVPLVATVDILVNSRGPAVSCNGDGTMIDMTPGANLTVSGSANDVNGVASITVNGVSVPIGTNGTFSRAIPTRFGMNFVDVTATDSFGEPTTRVCTFLVSNRYFAQASTIPDTVSLKLIQSAIDDMNRSGALGSLGDLLHTVLNSDGLKTTVHNTLLAANPLKPMACDSSGPFGICWYRSEVRYNSSMFNGPNTVSLTLVDGGMRAIARLNNIRVNLRVRGDVVGVGYDTTGWVNISHIEVQMTLDTSLSAGQPRITVRSGSVSSSVGSITTQFSGVDGWIINNIVVPLAQGQLQSALRNIITSFVRDNFNATLDGLISNLDISSLAASFNVPRLDGSGNVTLSFAVTFSSLGTTAARMLFGIGTRLTAPTANAIPTLGVALPPGTNLLDPGLGNPPNTGVGVHVGLVNHALHALWKANYFSVTLTNAQLGGNLPAGTSLAIVTRLPPVATILASGHVQLHLGAMDLTVQHPDLPPGLTVRFGADARTTVALSANGSDLVFGGIVVDEVYASTDIANLSAQQQMSLETALVQVAQQLVNQSLNNALPAIPIPAFTIPPSLVQYGLTAGDQIGINAPALTVAPQHFTLRGNFGIRP